MTQKLDLSPLMARFDRIREKVRRHPPIPLTYRCECMDLGWLLDVRKNHAYPCMRCRREQWEHWKRGGYLPDREGGTPLSLLKERNRARNGERG